MQPIPGGKTTIGERACKAGSHNTAVVRTENGLKFRCTNDVTTMALIPMR